MHEITYAPVLPKAVEIINDAIMSGQPNLILEGCTDIKIYQKISERIGKEIVLRPVELIEGYSAGCSNVIKFIEDLESDQAFNSFIKGNVIGIIDKDVRDYRNEIPSSNNIITMRPYSIESHFICKESVYSCFISATNSSLDEGCMKISQKIYTDFLMDSKLLFLASLDALKKSLNKEYSNIFSYGDSYEKLKNPEFEKKINDIKNDLEKFAQIENIVFDETSMKSIIKGKVFFDFFCNYLSKKLKSLVIDCRSLSFNKCIYCYDGRREQCLYKIRNKLSDQSIKVIIKGQFPENELNYLVSEIKYKVDIV